MTVTILPDSLHHEKVQVQMEVPKLNNGSASRNNGVSPSRSNDKSSTIASSGTAVTSVIFSSSVTPVLTSINLFNDLPTER
jgi:hypothetical protein